MRKNHGIAAIIFSFGITLMLCQLAPFFYDFPPPTKEQVIADARLSALAHSVRESIALEQELDAMPQTIVNSRWILVMSKSWVVHGAVPERNEELHYYLGILFDDDTVTVFRDVFSSEVEKLRTIIVDHNAALQSGNKGDPELSAAQIEIERKRAAAKRGGPSELFKTTR